MNASIVGGLLAMIGAVAWFVIGWMMGYIFFYPPILFIIGLVGCVRGMIGAEE